MQKLSRKAFQSYATRSSRQAVMSLTQKMGYLTKAKPANQYNRIVSAGGMRMFSSLPDHVLLEMPNLSPTMEKVSTRPLLIQADIDLIFFVYRVTFPSGTRRLVTPSSLETPSAVLRPTRPPLISRCRRKASSPS